MRTLLVFLLLTLSIHTNAQEKMKLIYVGDPMCSWCYGIANEWTEVVDHYKDAEVELVMGGLRPYNDETIASMKDFLRGHWEEVNKRSGQEFSYDILDRADLTYDTEPPSRAVVIVRALAPEKEVAFFKLVQKDFYFHNKDMSTSASYHNSLSKLEISIEEFDTKFEAPEAKENVRKDFERASELGVNSFPTVLLSKGDEIIPVARGYAESEKMIERIRAAQ